MPETVLTEYQSACRAAHEQAQLLRHLYERLLDDESALLNAQLNVDERTRQLERDQDLLAGRLEKLDLLKSQPDPEKERLLELFTDLKRAFSNEDNHAIAERLIKEERNYLKFIQQAAGHDSDESLSDAVLQTHAALGHLSTIASM
ncbi:MAG TPA: hypothetical protein VMO24_02940 [Woeseiaceae bacterium]|nr:hypothetical protein [Woeseiaceae bacterium]